MSGTKSESDSRLDPLEIRDYYKRLQVDSEADNDVIAAAYRVLAKKYHPDVDHSSSAHLRMQALNEAWEVIGNPDRRIQYDRIRAREGNAMGEESSPWSANFSQSPRKTHGSGRNFASNPGAYLHGVYLGLQSHRTTILRFYDDGLVIAKIGPPRHGIPKRISKPSRWMGKSYDASGSYVLAGAMLEFSLGTPDGPFQYSGQAWKERLELDIEDLVSGQKDCKVKFHLV